MRAIAPVFLFLLTATTVFAYNPIEVEPPEAYAIIPIEGDPYIQREYLGDLEDFPDMYELTSDVSFTLSLKVRQRASKDAQPYGLIVVRQNDTDGGVTEIARLNQSVEDWEKASEPSLGMTFFESMTLEKEVTPGTYRIEVSTPDNRGEYMLVVGNESHSSNFFKALGQIYLTQKHFNYTPFHMLFSSYVLYPLGIILVIVGMIYTWKLRRK
ncbi:MAG TPA: hypothetical protein VGE31_02905 [Candidatus Paceibacterota bacterium]